MTAALAACSGTPSNGPGSVVTSTVSPEEVQRALRTPTELTFWTWVPGLERQAALFHRKYPAITVKVVNAGQGHAHYAKLRTALRAGAGAPDLAQMEFQYIPTFTLTDDLLDLAPYGAGRLADRFVDWTWRQVLGERGQILAVPQDTGPMGMLYRADILSRYGITPPRTWAEFATAARALHAAAPEVHLTNLSGNEAGAWMGLMWQAGARPFGAPSRGKVALNLTDAASRRVAEYWQDLIADGSVSTDPDFTDQWYQGLNRGRYAIWLTAAWGPMFLSGSAKATAGNWRAAPLPQWSPNGAQISGNWGGSTTAVLRGTAHPIAAAAFAEFLNTDPESTRMLARDQFLFPATKGLLEDPAFIDQTSDFYGGQQVNRVFASISRTVSADFQWPPFLDQVVTDWDDTVGRSLGRHTGLTEALDLWQERVTRYARGQGFTVTGP